MGSGQRNKATITSRQLIHMCYTLYINYMFKVYTHIERQTDRIQYLIRTTFNSCSQQQVSS